LNLSIMPPTNSALPMLDPTPELPDDTLISRLQFPTRIQNVLSGAGLRTVGEVREASDEMLLSLPDLGPASVTHLRETLGLPSTDGARPR
jgi:DNA-directed RNA polymerase alpha subunit